MAAHSKDKSEASASHSRRETRRRTGASEKQSRAMDAAPASDRIDDPSAAPPEEDRHATADTDDGADRLHQATAYLRDHDVDDVVRDAMAIVRDNPLVVLLVFGGVVLGGAAVVASLRQGGSGSSEGGMSTPRNLIDAKTYETLGRMRQAAFSFALAKVVDSIDHNFPGFREHFEKS